MIIWLASYPKSGNTWVRSLLSNYIYTNYDQSTLNKTDLIKRFPSKQQLEGICEFEKLKQETEISKHWITAQSKINFYQGLVFLKTHNIASSYKGNEFTDFNNTSGSIYVVRDPRSVALSYAHWLNKPLNETIDEMLNSDILALNEDQTLEVRSSWKNNYLSWKNSPYPKIIIRYEDLHQDIVNSFKKILNFINLFEKIEIDENKIYDVIKKCSFKNLSEIEKKDGFIQNYSKTNFFRKGLTDEWKTELDKNLIKKIETNLENEMKELNYL